MATEILTQERILESAEDVLRRFGPQKTTVVDVARDLNVSHGSVYRHFDDKAALREAVVLRWLKRITLPLLSIAWQQSSPQERLERWLETFIGVMQKAAKNEPELFAAYALLSAEPQGLDNFHEQMIEQLAVIAEEGLTSNHFKQGLEPKQLAQALYQASYAFHHPSHVANWFDAAFAPAFKSVFSLLMNGVLQPKSA